MYIVLQKVFYTITEMCQQENLPKSVLMKLIADPRFAAITLSEKGKILIAEGAVNALQELREKNATVPAGVFPDNPPWNWNLPNVKHICRSDLETLFGISRATSYTLVHSKDFPVDPTLSSTRLYVRTDELSKWLNKRAMVLHNIYKGAKMQKSDAF